MVLKELAIEVVIGSILSVGSPMEQVDSNCSYPYFCHYYHTGLCYCNWCYHMTLYHHFDIQVHDHDLGNRNPVYGIGFLSYGYVVTGLGDCFVLVVYDCKRYIVRNCGCCC